jgi:hypothetical protein
MYLNCHCLKFLNKPMFSCVPADLTTSLSKTSFSTPMCLWSAHRLLHFCAGDAPDRHGAGNLRRLPHYLLPILWHLLGYLHVSEPPPGTDFPITVPWHHLHIHAFTHPVPCVSLCYLPFYICDVYSPCPNPRIIVLKCLPYIVWK